MARPEAVRRVKSYSSESGYVYQYYFFEVQKSRRGGISGTEYVYMVSTDRKTVFPVRIFVRLDAVEAWAARTGRALSGTEEYAVAKMRLFQVFDDSEQLVPGAHDYFVDQSNLDQLLALLDL
ncbi:MAG: hypothetical protein WBF06_14860 [Candidatus Acidiferrales bacterium]